MLNICPENGFLLDFRPVGRFPTAFGYMLYHNYTYKLSAIEITLKSVMTPVC